MFYDDTINFATIYSHFHTILCRIFSKPINFINFKHPENICAAYVNCRRLRIHTTSTPLNNQDNVCVCVCTSKQNSF